MFKLLTLIAAIFTAIPELLTGAFTWATVHFQIAWLDLKMFFINTSISLLSTFVDVESLVIGLNSAFSALPTTALYIANILQLPAAIQIMLSAYAVKFTLSFFRK